MGILGTMVRNFENGSFAIWPFVSIEYLQPTRAFEVGTKKNHDIVNFNQQNDSHFIGRQSRNTPFCLGFILLT